ncbi:MAG: hypothetical protein OHK0046_24840 [Anaerolineae bacterium]
METALQDTAQRQPTPPPRTLPRAVPLSIIWNIIVAAASLYFSISIFNLEEFADLGDPVQYFIAVVALLPALFAGLSTVYILQRKSDGRYIAMTLYFVGFTLSFIYLLHLWGVYFGFEPLVDGIMRAPWLLLGLPLAYAVFWIAGKVEAPARNWLETAAAGIGMLALMGVLLAANVLDGAVHVLNTYSEPATWMTTVTMIIFGVLSYQMLMLGDYFGETPEQRTAWQGWIMLAPNIIGFSLFFAGPLLLSFYLSFTNNAIGTDVPRVIGFENYGRILSIQFETQTDLTVPAQSLLDRGYNVLATLRLGDTRYVIGAQDVIFWLSLRNTLLFCLLLIPLAVMPALALSMILNSKIPGMKFFRAIYFLPSVAAVVGTALIWRWLYHPTIGYFNYVIAGIVDFLNSLGFNVTDPDIQWLTNPAFVLISMVLLSAWQVVGYNTVLFLAGLQGIPKELYEAAMIDGANRWRQFLNVTLPMLAPTTFFVMITTIVTGLQVFNEPYTLFNARPLPVNATTSVFYLYERGFQRGEFGYSSSLAWLLFIIIFGITLIQFRIQRSNAYES